MNSNLAYKYPDPDPDLPENVVPEPNILHLEQTDADGDKLKREAWERRRQRRLKIMFPFIMMTVFLVYAFTTNYIPSHSMEPTLKPGDNIVTMRTWLAYPGGRMPARGDIIIFRMPQNKAQEEEGPVEEDGGRRKLGVFRNESGEILIKRVVGLPGETVEIKDEGVYINGRLIPSPIPQTYRTTWLAVGEYAINAPLHLGPDELFVLGDNPGTSDDGRFWGPLKRSDVLGKFVFVLFHRHDAERYARNDN